MVDLLRRTAAIVGTIVMLPVALNMYQGNLTPADAGIRAALIFGAVVVARRLVGYLSFLEKMPMPVIRTTDQS
jgi:purine-cytosine permease-like protein